jgi:RNA polymerase sigma factor for flagellar operon FliA
MAAAHAMYKMIALEEDDCAERNEMILRELPQVQYIASRILERLPQQVELSDLVQAGVIGLLEAYKSFDSTKNAQFSTFARFRIKGAILDSLRALDWGSRGVRKKGRDIGAATLKLQQTLGRVPTTEELAAELQVSITELQEIQVELSGLHLVGQEVQSSFDGEDTFDVINGAVSEWDNPFEMYCKTEERAHLAEAIRDLSEREQLILSLYYREELTMKEVAQIVDLAVSRVSQIHAAALTKLKHSLTRRKPQVASTLIARSAS